MTDHIPPFSDEELAAIEGDPTSAGVYKMTAAEVRRYQERGEIPVHPDPQVRVVTPPYEIGNHWIVRWYTPLKGTE